MRDFLKINIDHKRVYGLDILRCLAILFVVIGHGQHFLPGYISKYISYLVFDGVSIFFVLSGFLIGGILTKTLEKERASFKTLLNFWTRRWLRTLPNYFFVLILLACFWFIVNDKFTLRGINQYFYFSQNLFSRHPDWFFPEAWSLSIEEWFYLLIPIFIFGMAGLNLTDNRRAIVYTTVIILLLATSFRLYRYYTLQVADMYDWDSIFRKQVSTRLDSLMYGVAGAYVSYYYKTVWLKLKYPLFFLGLLLLLPEKFLLPEMKFGIYHCVFSFSVTSIGVLLMLPYLSDKKQGGGWLFTSVTYISLISYSMYLLHLSIVQGWIMYLLRLIVGRAQSFGISDLNFLSPYVFAIKYFLYWFFTIVLSIIVYKYLEVPMMKLRDRLK